MTGKNRLQSLSPGFLWEMGLAQTHGDTKYAPGNWHAGKEHREEYIGALLRHLLTYWAGETYDRETGLHHMAHLALSAMFLHWFDEGEELPQRTCLCVVCTTQAPGTSTVSTRARQEQLAVEQQLAG